MAAGRRSIELAKHERAAFRSPTVIAALGQLGRAEEARTELMELLLISPQYNIAEEVRAMEQAYRRREAIDHFADGLRQGGVPE